jgi:hypothetical protein
MAADDEDVAVVPGLDRHVYGGAPPSNRRSMARARLVRRGQTVACGLGGLQGALGRGRVGKARPGTAGGLGRRAAWTPRSSGAPAHATSRRGGALAQIVLPVTSLKLIFSKILYTSAPNVEYESCRSSYPLPLSKLLYSVFLNRFCREGLPTLNATQLP